MTKKSGTSSKPVKRLKIKRLKSAPLLKDVSKNVRRKSLSGKRKGRSLTERGSISQDGNPVIPKKSAAGEIYAVVKRIPAVILTVHVERPQSKQSTQFGRGHAFTPAKKRKYMKLLADSFREQYNGKPMSGTFFIEIVYYFKKGKKHREGELMNTCADVIDNLNKPVGDALSGIVLEDDRKICGALVFKARSALPRIEVSIFRVLEDV